MLNVKAFSFALLALVAIGAFAAQGASAVPLTIEPPEPKVFITDLSGGMEIVISATVLNCNQGIARASATPAAGAVHEITLTPEYSCTLPGFPNVDTKINGCAYTLTTPTTVKPGEVTYHPSQFHLVCPAGKKIDLTPTTFGLSVCTLSFPEQTPTSGHIVARNVVGSSPMNIAIEFKILGTHYSSTGGACGTSGTTGEFVANTIGKCFKDEAHTVQFGCTFS